METSAHAALAKNRFDSENDLMNRETGTVAFANDEQKPTLSPYREKEEARPIPLQPFRSEHSSAEHLTDLLWLAGAIVIIFIIHQNIPTSGAPPHSIVEVVTSARVFPK